MNWSDVNQLIYPVPPVMKTRMGKDSPYPYKKQEKKKEVVKDKNGKTFQDYLDELTKKDE